MRVALLFTVAGVFLGTCAAAQTRDNNQKQCSDSVNPDLAIAACTTIIQSGQETTDNVAGVFNDRGNAYLGKRDIDRAIQDYDQAVRLDPKEALAFVSRGNAYVEKGDSSRAIEDYDQAIRLDSNFALATSRRKSDALSR